MLSVNHLRTFVLIGGLVMSAAASALPAVAAEEKKEGSFSGIMQDSLGKAAPKALQGSGQGKDALPNIVAGLISAVVGFLGVVLFLYLLYGGYKWMTAGGDATQVKEATAIIKNAIIGLVIIAASYAIATFVVTSLSEATGGQQEG